mgnify:CR=1 FL=1
MNILKGRSFGSGSLCVRSSTSFRGSEAGEEYLLSFSRSAAHASDANPAKRIASEKEEQGSGRSFRRKAEAESSGLCDDAIPRLVPLGETTTYPSAPPQGIPAAEDDGGEGGSPASAVGRVPLTVGFHGLRPMNDGESGFPQPPGA